MKRKWLVETYHRIKQSRDERLARVLTLLRPKAEVDSEIGEVVGILESWAAGGESGGSHGPPPDTDEETKNKISQGASGDAPSDSPE